MAFMVTTMVIAVPSAIKTFNWLGTLWGGRIQFTVPMLYALAFVSMFVIGGLSAASSWPRRRSTSTSTTRTSSSPTSTTWSSAARSSALFAAIYYWFPKMFGRMMNAALGHLHFWGTLIFFNWAFFPMHIIGVGGHMRRIYNPMQYEFLQHQQHWNVFMTYGALLLGASQILFVINFFWSLFAGTQGADEPVEREHARVVGGLAAAAPQLGSHDPDRVPRAVRVQRSRGGRGLSAAVAGAGARSGRRGRGGH